MSSRRLITEEHAYFGVERAAARVGELIHRPALSGLSPVDRSFLAAMSVDEGPSSMADITARLGVDRNYASQYRLRLIAAGLISEAGRGRVEFTLPYLGEYLREQTPATSGPAESQRPPAAPQRTHQEPRTPLNPYRAEQALAATRHPFGATLPGHDGPSPGR